MNYTKENRPIGSGGLQVVFTGYLRTNYHPNIIKELTANNKGA
jgi:hypothetical protein